MEAVLTPTYIGQTGESGVFRIDLSQSGLSSILSIVIEDDNQISGGSGAASGFDVDLVKIASTLTSSPSTASSTPGLNVFNFSPTGVVFKPGFLQPYNFFDPAIANQDRLFGTINGVLNIPGATFDLLDGVDWNGAVSGLENSVSIGEGGRLAFTLSTAISPSGLYLYVADVGGGNDDFRVRVSDSLPNLSAGLTLTGTDGDDIIDLLKGFNAALGLGNDILNGGDGNDTILSGAGDDTVGGDAGNDILNCGVGNDTVTGGTGTDQLVGDVGNDILNGGEDNDTIDCGKGNDRVVAALGNDRVTLGKGKDICEVIRGIGVTKILDFRDRQDRIDLAKGIKFGKLDIDQRGRNTKISINGDPLAVLINVQVSVLTAADFT